MNFIHFNLTLCVLNQTKTHLFTSLLVDLLQVTAVITRMGRFIVAPHPAYSKNQELLNNPASLIIVTIKLYNKNTPQISADGWL